MLLLGCFLYRCFRRNHQHCVCIHAAYPFLSGPPSAPGPAQFSQPMGGPQQPRPPGPPGAPGFYPPPGPPGPGTTAPHMTAPRPSFGQGDCLFIYFACSDLNCNHLLSVTFLIDLIQAWKDHNHLPLGLILIKYRDLS